VTGLVGEPTAPVIERLQIRARGMVFDARAAGPTSGRGVLLLHGFPQTSLSWKHQLTTLGAAGMRAVAFDQRGYSSAARPAEVKDYRLRELVEDCLAVAGALGFERFDVVGHDWGAMVAWVLSGRHPDRVRTLTAVSVPHPWAFAAAVRADSDGGDQKRRSSYIEVFRLPGHVAEQRLLGDDGKGDGLRAMFTATGLSPDAPELEEFVAVMRQPGALTAALNWYRAMAAEEAADVGIIEVPTLFVWSTADTAIGRRAAEECGRFVSGPYRFEVLEDVSHWIPETAPGTLSQLLLEHLRD
jgi:pimeloyl-ACP methyl ester carboxylesterase